MEPVDRRTSTIVDVTEEFECPICYNTLVTEQITRLACAHLFCSPCINRWLHIDKHNVCPLCRTKVINLAEGQQDQLESAPHIQNIERIGHIWRNEMSYDFHFSSRTQGPASTSLNNSMLSLHYYF